MASLPEPVSLACNDIHLAFGTNKVLRGVTSVAEVLSVTQEDMA